MSGEPLRRRCGWAGWRCKTGILVHSFDHWAAAVRDDRQARSRIASGRKPELPERVLVGTPLAARRARGWPRSPTCCRTMRRRLPEARLPLESPGDGRGAGRLGGRWPQVLRAAPGCTPAAAEAGRRRRRARCRPWWRCAARSMARLPRRRAQGDRRLRARRRARSTSPRSTSAAARTWSGRCSPPLPPATSSVAPPACARAAARPGWWQAWPRSGAATEAFELDDRGTASSPLAQALQRPGYELQRVAATQRADRRTSSRWPRRRCDEVLRLEGAEV